MRIFRIAFSLLLFCVCLQAQTDVQSFAPLDPGDPAIPFDRLPYVPGDLRRVATMAGFMLLLIIVAAIVVTHTVG